MADHDLSYKHLFSHYEMVRDLFEGFVREDLLEFQSTVDADMAVRMLSYASLRYQDLLKSGRLRSGGPLPPVLPIVLYNGRDAWSAAESSGELIHHAPTGVEPYQPQMRYLLIDIARYQKDELARMRNLVASMFRLENSSTSEDVDEVTGDLHEWWENTARASLRNAFIKWLDRVIIPRHLRDPSAPTHNLEEKNMSLAEAVEDWRAKYRGEGRLAGQIEGRLEGQLNGERQILGRQLRKRFGELPSAVTQRLQQAQTEELERWAERLLDARTLTELFADNAIEA